MLRLLRAAMGALLVASGMCLVAPNASAIQDGEVLSAAPSWVAYLTITKPKWFVIEETSNCSGALLSPEWVVTAAHCVANLDANGSDYKTVKPSAISVQLGRTSSNKSASKFNVDRIEMQRYRDAPSGGGRDDDIALLHLTKRSSAAPLQVLPSSSLATNGTPVTLYGYGVTKPYKEAEAAGEVTGTLRRTKPTNVLYTDCVAANDGRVCVRDSSESLGMAGDSGGPWTTIVDGSPLLTLVFSGYVKDEAQKQSWQLGEAVYDSDTNPWLRSTVGIPDPTPGSIVRDSATAKAWLIDGDGFRRSIPDGGVYTCLVEQGADVASLDGGAIQLLPQRSAEARCGGGDIFIFGVDVESGDLEAIPPTMRSKGYSVTVGTTLPNNLDAFDQVWVLTTYTEYAPEVRTALRDYVLAGGSLLMNSEHACCSSTNAGAQALMNDILTAEIQVVTACASPCADATDPVLSSAVGGVANTPNANVSLSTRAVGIYRGVPSANQLVIHGTDVVATVWGPGDTETGKGKLVTVGDSNWTDSGTFEVLNASFAENVAAYLRP